eukprot:870436-Prymnesium_polylepis.3
MRGGRRQQRHVPTRPRRALAATATRAPPSVGGGRLDVARLCRDAALCREDAAVRLGPAVTRVDGMRRLEPTHPWGATLLRRHLPRLGERDEVTTCRCRRGLQRTANHVEELVGDVLARFEPNAERLEIGHGGGHGAHVRGAATAVEQQQLVRELKDLEARLVEHRAHGDAGGGEAAEALHELERDGRVEAGGGLVEEDKRRVGHELSRSGVRPIGRP